MVPNLGVYKYTSLVICLSSCTDLSQRNSLCIRHHRISYSHTVGLVYDRYTTVTIVIISCYYDMLVDDDTLFTVVEFPIR